VYINPKEGRTLSSNMFCVRKLLLKISILALVVNPTLQQNAVEPKGVSKIINKVQNSVVLSDTVLKTFVSLCQRSIISPLVVLIVVVSDSSGN